MASFRENDVLCEDCGYPLGDCRGRCPECGRLAETSYPAARPGSPWQRSPGVGSWGRTLVALARSPAGLFRAIRISRHHAWTLLLINVILAGALVAAPWTGTLIGDPSRGAANGGGAKGVLLLAASFGLETLLVAFWLVALTMVEYLGVRFFAARRGWRLTRAGALQVCCHASYAWILGGLAAMMTLALLYGVQRLSGWVPRGTLDLGPGLPIRVSWYQLTGGAGLVLGYFAGLLMFECLTYVGVRACRYAAAAESDPGALRSLHAPERNPALERAEH